jgi:phosphodiesterase/alkaline phosphatase D-like protein
LSGSLSTSHSVTITGLNVNTLYHFRVRSRDSFANLAISANNTVTTVDTGAPIISNVDAAATTETTATVTWTTNEPANRQVEYGTTDSLGSYSSIQTNLLTSHSVGLNALTPNTKYFYRVRSRDAAGNLTVSSIQTFITDVIPPTITVGPALSDLSGNSVTVSWATDEAADSQVLYGLTSGALTEETTLDATLVTSHTQSLTGLIENQIYFYQVQTRDEAGNITVSAEGTFSTDVTAPIVSSVIATPASTSATLQWTTNEQATSEFVYGLTTSYGTSGGTTILVTSHNQTIMSLTPGTTYYYEIRSKDAAGNTGVQAGTFTTGS